VTVFVCRETLLCLLEFWEVQFVAVLYVYPFSMQLLEGSKKLPCDRPVLGSNYLATWHNHNQLVMKTLMTVIVPSVGLIELLQVPFGLYEELSWGGISVSVNVPRLWQQQLNWAFLTALKTLIWCLYTMSCLNRLNLLCVSIWTDHMLLTSEDDTKSLVQIVKVSSNVFMIIK
jgi:hypothetical protein